MPVAIYGVRTALISSEMEPIMALDTTKRDGSAQSGSDETGVGMN